MRGIKIENLLGYELKIIPDGESRYFAVRFPDFPCIVTGGHSLEQAIRSAGEALGLTLDTMKKHKLPLPKPKTRFRGQFNVRVPKDLHRELVRRADKGWKWKTFRFLILNRAGRIGWDQGAKVLYLTFNRATKQLYDRIGNALNNPTLKKAA